MGLIRKSLRVATLPAGPLGVKGSSKKQRVAKSTLRAAEAQTRVLEAQLRLLERAADPTIAEREREEAEREARRRQAKIAARQAKKAERQAEREVRAQARREPKPQSPASSSNELPTLQTLDGLSVRRLGRSIADAFKPLDGR